MPVILAALLAVGALVSGPAPSARAATIFTPLDVSPSDWQQMPGHAQLYGWGAATMLDGSILMGDYWNLRVQRAVLNPDGSIASIDPNFITNDGFQAGQHQAPYGLAVDPVSGNIYMADTDRYGVDVYSPSGTFLLEWGTQGDGANKFLYPSRVAVRSDGRVYVADTWANQIVVDNVNTSARTVTEQGTFGTFGTGPGCKMKQPHGMAWWYGPDGTASISDDRLFVVDANNKQIDVFGSDPTASVYGPGCNWLYSFGQGGPGASNFTGDLRGLAIDPNDPESSTGAAVYVVDAAGNRIRKFATDGTWLRTFGVTAANPTAPEPGSFSDGGREITVDARHRVWVGDMPGFRFQVFNGLTGQVVTTIPDVPGGYSPPPTDGFNGPRGVAIDAAGDRFVTDTYNQRILKYDAQGNFVTQWGSRGRDDYAFNYARLIAVSPPDQSVVVADTDNHSIKKFTNDGVFECRAGGLGSAGQLMRNPHGVDVAADGTIFVTDSRNGLLKAFDPNCRFLFASTYAKGTSPQSGQLNFPRGIAVDPADDSVWVADSSQDVVKHYAVNIGAGTFTWLGTLGSKGTAANQWHDPFDVEVAGDRLIVADTGSNMLKVWNTQTGQFVEAYGGGGTALGKFQQPQGMDVSPLDGTLWVAEQRNERLQHLAIEPVVTPPDDDPELAQTIGGPGHASMYPSGLEYSAVDDTLVVADTGNHTIEKFDPANGGLIWSVGGYGTGDGTFSDPRDLGVGSDGSIYVADTGNTRIVKLAPDGTWITSYRGPAVDTVGSPIGVSVSAVGGQDRVYVADGSKLKVRVYDAALTSQLTTASSNGACSFSNIRDVDADSDGNMYVANYLKNDILKLDPDGICLGTWGTKGSGHDQFKNPYGVRVATDGVDGVERVYVADSNNNRIQVFDTDGTYVDSFGSFGAEDGAGRFTALRRVAVSPDGDLWGADLWGFAIEHADARGLHTDPGGAYTWADSVPRTYTPAPFTADAVFNEVRQVAFDADGSMLAMDGVNQRIVKVDPTTGALLPFGSAPWCGKRGWENGAFNWPRGVAVDPDTGNIWVADTKQSQLQIFTSGCSFIAKVPTTASSPDKFNWPFAIAARASDDTMWVADSKNNRIKVYSAATRQLLATFGAKGSGVGQFNQPSGISIDPVTGNVLVADANNNRIVELSATANAGTISWVRSRAGFKRPSGVARDEQGRTYVADTMNDRVVVLSATNWTATTAELTDGMSQPEQVAVGPDGRIYVSDTYHDRILVYAYPQP
jgi:DNA-binding beta-propeller fold protein YncE